jgi:recombination protein RecR
MLPDSLLLAVDKIYNLGGIGKKSAQKIALQILQLNQENFNDFILSLEEMKNNISYCTNCGFFSTKDLCNICLDSSRNTDQICLVESQIDVINMEKSLIFKGKYFVLERLLSPLENIFVQQTKIPNLLEKIETKFTDPLNSNKLELIVFLRQNFNSDTTLAYIKDALNSKPYFSSIKFTKLAEGLPLYYNPDTLDQATMIKALEDRKEI